MENQAVVPYKNCSSKRKGQNKVGFKPLLTKVILRASADDCLHPNRKVNKIAKLYHEEVPLERLVGNIAKIKNRTLKHSLRS